MFWHMKLVSFSKQPSNHCRLLRRNKHNVTAWNWLTCWNNHSANSQPSKWELLNDQMEYYELESELLNPRIQCLSISHKDLSIKISKQIIEILWIGLLVTRILCCHLRYVQNMYTVMHQNDYSYVGFPEEKSDCFKVISSPQSNFAKLWQSIFTHIHSIFQSHHKLKELQIPGYCSHHTEDWTQIIYHTDHSDHDKTAVR